MPFSDFYHIPVVLHFALAAQPKSILDVGVGMGAYGLLLRQHLDICNQRLSREQWQLRIDGVEVFEGYRNPVWDYAYTSVIMGDAREVLAGMSGATGDANAQRLYLLTGISRDDDAGTAAYLPRLSFTMTFTDPRSRISSA